MSYDAERIGISNFLNAQSFFGIQPFALEGDPIDLEDGGGFMTILSGAAVQASVGAPGANCHRYPGVLAITIVDRDARLAKKLADAVVDGLTGVKIDETGAAVSPSSTVSIAFAQDGGLVPYISESRAESPFHRVAVNAPFVRTERK